MSHLVYRGGLELDNACRTPGRICGPEFFWDSVEAATILENANGKRNRISQLLNTAREILTGLSKHPLLPPVAAENSGPGKPN